MRALDDCVSRGLVQHDRLLQPRRLADHEGARHFRQARLRALRDGAGLLLDRGARARARDRAAGRGPGPRRDGVEPARRRIPVRQIHPRQARRQRFAPHGVRFPAGRQGARLRHHRRHGADRQGARRLGGARRARLALAAQGRDERHHRRQDRRAARRQSRRRRADAQRRKRSRNSTRRARSSPNIPAGCWRGRPKVACPRRRR